MPSDSSRFIDIPLPEPSTIPELLKINLQSVPLAEDVNLEELGQRLSGYSGADITTVCRDASMMPMRRRIQGLTPEQIRSLPKEELTTPVLKSDFEAAINRIQSSVSASDIERYEKWLSEYGSA
jgi:katanin p60 ATPase-containing subunit A1